LFPETKLFEPKNLQMRNVLIPTDFSVASLAMVEKTARTLEGESLNMILFHAFEIPASETEMLDIRNKLPYQDLVTEAFRNACKRIKMQQGKTIRSIAIRHLYGSTAAVFRNFVDANDIDLIVIPEGYVFQAVHPGSVNPEGMFRKASVPLLTAFKPVQKPKEATIASLETQSGLKTASIKNEKHYAVKEEYPVSLHIRQDTV
jgi:hypothetical protein